MCVTLERVEVLALRGNPMVELFPEYQVSVAASVPIALFTGFARGLWGQERVW